MGAVDRYKLAVGFLRQWLNEDRIGRDGKMVTSEELHHWLDDGVEDYIRDCVIAELENWRMFLGANKVIADELDERIAKLKRSNDERTTFL